MPAGADVLDRPPEPADNRWQLGEIVEGLYFADSPETAWAEWYGFLAEVGLPPDRSLPRDLWRWEITLPNVANLTDSERATRCRGRYLWRPPETVDRPPIVPTGMRT